MSTYSDNDIAIIGFAGRFPGASNAENFWQNLVANKCNIVEFSKEECVNSGVTLTDVENPNYRRVKGYLEDCEQFDSSLFKISNYDAEILDPQYRLLLEVTWQALEHAGFEPNNIREKTGVFVGSSNINNYLQQVIEDIGSNITSKKFNVMLHNMKDFLPKLISYKFNLKGPSVAIQTACSTSLVSVCIASQNILLDDCDVAIAGGTCVTYPLKSGYLYQEGMMLSKSGKYRVFDEKSDGIVLGNGAGIVILKKLSSAIRDNNTVHAIIKGHAINNDGNEKIGFTAPSVLGQQEAITMALKKAHITPQEISYIETHGTGTVLGDLIEIEALKDVFNECKKNSILIGSVKPNIGHLDAASGIANLIKCILSLKHGLFPAMINLKQQNSKLQLHESPFQINTKPFNFDNSKNVYVGTSSFGIGGTNAQLVLTNFIGVDTKQKCTSNSKQKKELTIFHQNYYWYNHTAGLQKFKPASSLSNTNLLENKSIINDIQITLLSVFSKFLMVSNMSIDDKFYDLGGDSLCAILISHEINKQLNYKIPFSIYEYNFSIKELTENIINHIENSNRE
jgi:acyl transferase domain-containing protein/acyl carrier protein